MAAYYSSKRSGNEVAVLGATLQKMARASRVREQRQRAEAKIAWKKKREEI
jgi:hypothetical protein